MCAWVTNYFSNIQLFATHWTAVRQSPLSMEFSRQEYWGGLPVLPSRVSSDPGMEPASLTSPALARSFFTTSATWESPLERMQSVSQSVQSLSHLQLFATPRTAPHQASLSITNTRVCPNPCPLSWWCHSTISSSIIPFSSCAQSFPASGSFPAIFLDSKIIADGDCSHETKRCLLLGRKVMTNLDSILKSRDITLPTKVRLVKAMVFPVVMYGCESWTVKKVEHQKIDAFELWCWRRLLRVPWTARRSNQSILKEISPG